MSNLVPGLPEDAIRSLFPFLLVFDEGLRVVEAGPSLPQVAPDVAQGASLVGAFVWERHPPPLTFEALVGAGKRLVVLRHVATGRRLRGQVIRLRGAASAVFLGTPWFVDPLEVEAAGLSLSDFAAHDQTLDMLQLVQQERRTISDLERLNTRLREQSERLKAQEAETRRLAAEEAARRVVDDVRRMVALGATRAINGAETLVDAATGVVKAVVVPLGWRCGSLWTRSGDTLRCEAHWHVDDPALESFAAATRSVALRVGDSLPGQVVATGHALWVKDVSAPPNFLRAQAAKDSGLHAAFSLPVALERQATKAHPATRGGDDRARRAVVRHIIHVGP
jgi:hypothetical protein